jgi:hypothetical protein
MFQKAGVQNIVITGVRITEPKYTKNPAAFALCFTVTHPEDEHQTDEVFLDVCEDYGKGNFSQQKQIEIAMDKLHKLGCEVTNLYDGAQLAFVKSEMTGKTAPVMFEEEEYQGKKYIRAKYFATGGPGAAELSEDELKRRLALLTGGGEAPAPTPPAPTTAQKKPSVFGKKTAFPGSAAAKA